MSDLLVQPVAPALVPAQGPERNAPVLYDSGTAVVAARVRETWTRAASVQDSPASRAEWADRVVAALGPGERAISSLTFADGADVAHRVETRRRLSAHDSHAGRGPVTHTAVEVPSAARYADQVAEALERIELGHVDKVVLGRCVDVRSTPALDPRQVLLRLLETRPGKHVYSVPLTSDLREGPVLLGASPELLVSRNGRQVVSHPLAGSVPRSPDPVEDAARAERLASSVKDLAEHAYVVDAIVATLRQVCDDVVADEVGVVSTDTMWHLGTRITAVLRSDAVAAGTAPSALHLAQMLHPTPAVGGVPQAAAVTAIAETEGDLRGPLAGAVGWVDAAGDGEFAVAIRAGVLHGDRMRLFAGAGIVAGSDPWSEARETGAKLLTMAGVLGLPDDAITLAPTDPAAPAPHPGRYEVGITDGASPVPTDVEGEGR